jgi:hypothetical protein
VEKVSVNIPLQTEVILAQQNMVTGTSYIGKSEGICVEMDVRRAPWNKILGISRRTKIHWADVRQSNIKELSSLFCPIYYRLTHGDGWYWGKDGKRNYFPLQPHLHGIDLSRKCTTVTIRAAVLMAVMAGVGLRTVCWLMSLLFHLNLSKSSLDRWIKECANQLPNGADMARMLNDIKTITEAHFDEIFPKGQRPKRCTLVLRDEHGRIFAAREIEERTKKTVTAFLQEVKSWGLHLKAFYVDGCEAYRKAIPNVYPDATIQYDYFHVIQNIWRKIRKAFVAHRRDIKQRSKKVTSPWYKAKLENLAKRLWDNRGLVFKNPDNMTPEDSQRLNDLMEEDRFVDTCRHFMQRVWGIFRDSKGELGARQRLGRLKQHPEVKRDSTSPFAKSIAFLEDRFEDMIAYLRHPGVKRNSLAETGIRCLRRLERGHDGFRGASGLDRYLRIYQAVKYCGWKVHSSTSGLGLPGPNSVIGPPTELAAKAAS